MIFYLWKDDEDYIFECKCLYHGIGHAPKQQFNTHSDSSDVGEGSRVFVEDVEDNEAIEASNAPGLSSKLKLRIK